MLIAVTLVALMAVGLWAVFTISIRSWSRVPNSSMPISGTGAFWTWFENSWLQPTACMAKLSRRKPNWPPPIDPRADFQRGAGLTALYQPEFPAISGEPGLTLVSYEVARDLKGDYALVEKEARYLGQAPAKKSPSFRTGRSHL